MTRPRLYCDDHDCIPRCPHCQGEKMDDATITLKDLVWVGRLDTFIPIENDGYARPHGRFITLTCPDCERPSLLRLTETKTVLVASRTDKDLVLCGEA